MAWCRAATSHYLSKVDPDLCHHMVSLGHNGLNSTTLSYIQCISNVAQVRSWRSASQPVRTHYYDVTMSAVASKISNISTVCSAVCPGAHQRKTSKLRVTGLCEGNPLVTCCFPLQRPVTRKSSPFDDVIMGFDRCLERNRRQTISWTNDGLDHSSIHLYLATVCNDAQYSLRRHDIKMIFAIPNLCEGNPPVIGGFHHKGDVLRSFEFLLVMGWTRWWTVHVLVICDTCTMTLMYRYCNVSYVFVSHIALTFVYLSSITYVKLY